MLSLLGTAAVGSAGCTRLFRNEFRLHFVRVFNYRASEINIGVRVLRDGDIVFETESETVLGFDAVDEDPDPYYMDGPNVHVIESEWEAEPAVYDLEYLVAGRESWEEASFEEPETEHAALNLSVLKNRSVTVGTLEFEDRDELNYLLDREYRD